MNNRFVVIIIGLVIAFLGVVFFIKKDANSPSNGPAAASNHVQGKGTAGVTLLEYGDFQCPACGAYYPLVKQVKAKYGDKITFQFRNFPLVGSHPNAMSAHRAAEAASIQGKFWEMHDLLYERQESWQASPNPGEIFKSYAQELGLDIDLYTSDLVKSEIGTIIQQDIKAGTELGVKATPGFAINGQLLEENPRSVEDFVKLIDQAIKDKQE
jgi:protein-disulfide isomerase